jgi:hypothetical protein
MAKKSAKKKSAKSTRSTAEKQQEFLEKYAATGEILLASAKAEVNRRTHYRWLENPGYRDAFEKHKRFAAESLESEAVKRAKRGVLEPVHYQGKVCGHVKRYSDGLMMFLLRGMMPEKYGVNRQEISGPQGAPVQAKIEIVFVRPGDAS